MRAKGHARSQIDGARDWGQKARALYDEAYARRYRAHDDSLVDSGPFHRFAAWLGNVSRSFQPPIDVLDLGCGTGRYFCALAGVRDLVGLDASAAMLAEARRPYQADAITARSVTLIEGDVFRHQFEAGRFDLIYSIGVLAEHVPLDERLVSAVAGWLKPSGRFAFTTVHPESPSVPRTMRRRIGRTLARVAPQPVGDRIRTRLLSRGLYADEREVHRLLDPMFDVETIERFESEAHLHCLCLAVRKPA